MDQKRKVKHITGMDGVVRMPFQLNWKSFLLVRSLQADGLIDISTSFSSCIYTHSGFRMDRLFDEPDLLRTEYKVRHDGWLFDF